MPPSALQCGWHAPVTVLALTLLAAIPLYAHGQGIPPLSERLQLCAGCHNMNGNSVIPENPNLSAMDAEYLARQMADFKSGARKSPIMSGIIPMVDDKEFAALAQHFSTQKPGKGVVTDPKLVAAGKAIYDDGIIGSAVPSCSGCHNEDGSGTEKFPRIAGQHTAYVVQQLLNFKSGERANDSRALMRAVAKRMNENEIRAVAEYVATLSGGEQ